MSNFHQISFEQARDYIHSYLTFPELRDIAHNIAYDGIFEIREFPIQAVFEGFVLWFNWQEASPGFFLAKERNTFDSLARTPIEIKGPVLIRPGSECIFKFPSSQPPTHISISEYLKAPIIIPNQTSAVDIDSAVVKNNNWHYLAHFPDRDIHPFYQKTACSFFDQKQLTGEIDDGVKDFLTQGMSYVRYFIGLSTTEFSETKFIKVILMGVDDKGNMLWDETKGAKIIEHSWPPFS